MLTIVTPTGQIGSALVARLLDAGADLRLVARFPKKPAVADAVARGAQVVAGSLDDDEVLDRALEGSDALFWLTPPSYEADDVVARYAEFGAKAAAAVGRSGVSHVVHLSSFGAHLDAPVGPIRGNRAVERALNETNANVLHLRPAYFMDNDLWSIGTIKEHAALFIPVRGDRRVPRIATRDVARVAAARLLELDFTGKTTLELEGPARVTFDEAAAALAKAIGAPAHHVTVSAASAREALSQLGMTAGAAATVVELYDALDSGVLGGDPPAAPQKTATDVDTFAREVFLPAYEA